MEYGMAWAEGDLSGALTSMATVVDSCRAAEAAGCRPVVPLHALFGPVVCGRQMYGWRAVYDGGPVSPATLRESVSLA